MLLVSIRIHRKSALRYKFLILDTFSPDILYLDDQGCEDPWIFIKTNCSPRAFSCSQCCIWLLLSIGNLLKRVLEYDNKAEKKLYFIQIIMYEIHKCEFKFYYCSYRILKYYFVKSLTQFEENIRKIIFFP
jgi:hypothetical protein